MEAEVTLEQFVDESIRRAHAVGYHPTAFMTMWHNDRSPAPIERLVKSGDQKSGYKRMVKEGLKDWTLEAAVIKYPDRFSEAAKAGARFILDTPIDA